MIALSLGGLLGAIAGAILGAAAYVALIGRLDAVLRSMEGADAEGTGSGQGAALTRRAILGVDLALCMAIGYWVGSRYLTPAIGAE
ncbi:MAG TPA: hypothetical protein VK438_10090 [Xanthobacteraceae bacterium]|nr:hypothetical protein [Xanthobacteraceae bacterium]